jgi:pseudomonalisin
MSPRLKTVAATAMGVAGVALGSASAAQATTWHPTSTKATRLVSATNLAPRPASSPLQVTVALKLRNGSALRSFVAEVGRPGSPEFGHYLTPRQFEARFAPTRRQALSVERYLRANGFRGLSITANRLFVTGTGTTREAQRAFNTRLSTFTLDGRSEYANTVAASVPASLSGTVLSVLGLNDINGFRFPLQSKALTPASAVGCQLNPLTGNPYALCDYTPAGFRTAYDTRSLTGANTTIAIMAEGDLTQVIKDLRQAEKAWNEPQVPVSIVPVGLPSSDTSGADEWDLDTQYSTGMAREVKRLYVYDTTSLTDSDTALEFNKWATQDVAKAGSASFGECESLPYVDGAMVADDEVFGEAAAQGQTMHASAGDTGGQDCAVAPTNGVPESGAPNVNYPCSSPYVVCVGGTTLFTNPNGTYDLETAWIAGGGGISALEYSPIWQACVVPSNAAGDRGVPDIAMDADENTGAVVYVDGTPEGVGGTSLSSPLALGSWAVIETANGNRLGFASPLLYSLYPTAGCTDGVPAPQTMPLGTAANDPRYPLFDISLGSNGLYPATPGWDYTTGLGSYNVAATAEELGQLK